MTEVKKTTLKQLAELVRKTRKENPTFTWEQVSIALDGQGVKTPTGLQLTGAYCAYLSRRVKTKKAAAVVAEKIAQPAWGAGALFQTDGKNASVASLTKQMQYHLDEACRFRLQIALTNQAL